MIRSNELVRSLKTFNINALIEKGSESNKQTHHEIFVSVMIFQANTSGRPKKKIEKKIESQFLIDMFDEMVEIYDKFISIRQVLKINKIDMS